MHWNLLSYIQLSLPIIIGIASTIIHAAIKTPNDSQRAASLSKIAEGIAAIVMIQNPNATWAQMIELIVNQLKIEPNATTSSNTDVLRRAAAAALIASGIKPS